MKPIAKKIKLPRFHIPENLEFVFAFLAGIILTAGIIVYGLLTQPKISTPTPTPTPTYTSEVNNIESFTPAPATTSANIPTSPSAAFEYEVAAPPTPKPQDPGIVVVVNVVGSVTDPGGTASFTASFPQEGGIITGGITGPCEGDIYGVFDASTSQASGALKGTCLAYGYPVNAEGMFAGIINLQTKKASGTWQGRAGGLEKAGIWEVTF